MSTLTIQLPDSLRKRIEALAAHEGYSVSQFMASAAGEKLAVMLTMDFLRAEAAAGRERPPRMMMRQPTPPGRTDDTKGWRRDGPRWAGEGLIG